jgi:hypothetical protein
LNKDDLKISSPVPTKSHENLFVSVPRCVTFAFSTDKKRIKKTLKTITRTFTAQKVVLPFHPFTNSAEGNLKTKKASEVKGLRKRDLI